MLKERIIIQICVVLSILLLPLAHMKVMIFSLPLYSVEIPIVVAFVVYLYGWKNGVFLPAKNLNLRNPLVIGAGLFFCGAVLSFVVNPFHFTGLGMLKTWFVAPMILVWVWNESEPKTHDIEKMLLVWFGVVATVSFLSLEYFFQGNLTFDGRLSAWFTSPNYLAFSLAPGVLLSQYFFVHPIFEKKTWSKLIIACIFFSLLFSLFFTRSYAVWLSLATANGVFLFLTLKKEVSRQKKVTATVLLLFIFGSFLFLESSSEKWQALVSLQERSSLSSRMMIWQVAAKAIFEHSFFGIGIGRFQEVYLSYQQDFPLYLEWAVPQPHNLYLALWLQTGIIGLFGFGFLVVAWLRQMMILQKLSDEFFSVKKLSALLVSFLLFFLLFGFVDTPFFKTDQAFVFWFIIFFGASLIVENK